MFGGNSGSSALADTWTFGYQRPGPIEACRFGHDGDFDGLLGCADPDCFGICTPQCNPTIMTCSPSWPHCGDGVCQPVEDKRLCPADCGAASPICGDFLCESPETMQSCPGDCS